jgi:Peptidase family M23
MARITSHFQPGKRTDIPPEQLKAIGRGDGGHYGIDYSTHNKNGSALYTNRPMEVVSSRVINGYGNTIELRDPTRPDTTFFYAHLDELPTLKPGQQLQPGENFAFAGNSGSRGPKPYDPHLHYEVRKNGVAIDPEKYHKTNPHASSWSPNGGDLDTTEGDDGALKNGRPSASKPPVASPPKEQATKPSGQTNKYPNRTTRPNRVPSSISPLHNI